MFYDIHLLPSAVVCVSQMYLIVGFKSWKR